MSDENMDFNDVSDSWAELLAKAEADAGEPPILLMDWLNIQDSVNEADPPEEPRRSSMMHEERERPIVPGTSAAPADLAPADMAAADLAPADLAFANLASVSPTLAEMEAVSPLQLEFPPTPEYAVVKYQPLLFRYDIDVAETASELIKVATAVAVRQSFGGQNFEYAATSDSDESDDEANERQRQPLAQLPARRRSSESSSNSQLSSHSARSMRNAVERRRRSQINELFNELKEQLPACAGRRHVPKMVILYEAISYCRRLELQNQEREEIKKKQKELLDKVQSLTQTVLAELEKKKNNKKP